MRNKQHISGVDFLPVLIPVPVEASCSGTADSGQAPAARDMVSTTQESIRNNKGMMIIMEKFR